MKIIVNAQPDEMEEVVRLIMKNRDSFARQPERLGWGWHFHSNALGRSFFIRQIKGGLSASPSKGG
jgi:hypothetical protein